MRDALKAKLLAAGMSDAEILKLFADDIADAGLLALDAEAIVARCGSSLEVAQKAVQEIATALSASATKKYPEAFMAVVKPFAEALGLGFDVVAEKILELTGTPATDPDTLEILADSEAVSNAAILGAFQSETLKAPKINLNIRKLRAKSTATTAPPPLTTSVTASGVNLAALSLLPKPPDEDSLMKLLRVGGVADFGEAELVTAVRAFLVRRYANFFEIPRVLASRMEEVARRLQKPATKSFYEMQDELLRQKYGAVLQPWGLGQNYVTEARKNDFFAKLDQLLVPALLKFQEVLAAWQDLIAKNLPTAMAMNFQAQWMNPAMQQALAAVSQPPDTMQIRAAGAAVIDRFNIIFSFDGIPVCRALGFYAKKIKGFLVDPQMPALAGVVGGREEMLKEFGLAADLLDEMQERDMITLAMAATSLDKVGAEIEIGYFAQLVQVSGRLHLDQFGLKDGSKQSIFPPNTKSARLKPTLRPAFETEEVGDEDALS